VTEAALVANSTQASADALVLRRLDAANPQFDRELAALAAFEIGQDPDVDAVVARIVADVRARGDVALLEYTRTLDGVDAKAVAALEITASRDARCLSRRCPRRRVPLCKPLPRASARFTSGRSSSRGRIAMPTAASSVSG
jgi:histidinol dehydrogenase